MDTPGHAEAGTALSAPIPPADALPAAVARRGFNEAQWRTLCNNLYPGARSESVLMVLDYCLSRKLDPMKKPCHIVPMQVKDVATNTVRWRDVVMPGIYEYRTTAHRTNLYLGHSKPEYGPMTKVHAVEAPEWCEMTFYRWHQPSGRTVEFPVKVFFEEVVATTKDGANSRWSKAPTQMLTKCTEAAGLREAFPEEFGGEATAEEMDGRVIDSTQIEPISNVVQMPARKSEAVPPAATPPAPAPEPATAPVALQLPEHADQIVEVIARPTKDPTKSWYEALTARGVRCYTWSVAMREQLDAFKASAGLVDLVYEKDARGQIKIVSVQGFTAPPEASA